MRREEQHNRPEQVREYLVAALALVEDLDPPEDLRPLVFSKAVDLYASKQIFFEQVAPPLMAIPRGQ